jgi:sigma-B regulation protein RsbU (phosphoserine phosphatase)
MPPALLYRKSYGNTEELEIKGMPLGTFQDFPYQLVKNELHPGDTLLLYSDGLPELFNKKREMFGYERVVDVFNKNADEKAEVIIERLKDAGSEWVDDSPPDDDVTFVVIKARG